MNALKQYTDLYREHRETVDSNSAAPLNALRPRALAVLEEMELPAAGSENYELTDLGGLLSPDYGINLQRVAMAGSPAASFRCGVPTLSSILYHQVNDVFGKAGNVTESLPAGVWAGSLRQLAEEHPEAVKAHYGMLADMNNPVVALDTLLAQDGLAVWVRKGVRLERPIQMVNILNAAMPLMAVRRVLVIAEEDSEVKILSCDHTQNRDTDFLALQVVEIWAGRNAVVDYYDLEESGERTHRLSSLYLHQDEGSNVMLDGITLYNGTTRNEYHTLYAGPGASLRLYGMGIEDKGRVLDNYSCIRHASGHCHTDELFKYVVDDDARGAFGGLILVEPGAVKTEAYQSNRNMVGSDNARMFSKPQLEIYCDDVKCSHGSATGQLDALQLFYMRTRGLSEQTARLLLKQAFMADVIEGVRLQSLRERLHMLVERRFGGAEAGCAQCTAGCGTSAPE